MIDDHSSQSRNTVLIVEPTRTTVQRNGKPVERVIKFTGESTIDPSMLYPLLLSITAFYCLFTCCLLMNMRAELLERESRTKWVQRLVEGTT